ncbi:glycine zipper 2TM domain-containing protein [Burkholderia ubonensis]|uniref:3-hydroxyisobutyrate dehydrogenase n=1 Tax=Burkholderia ubonensis TaxID=101571 RepID=A0A107FAM8_9BURK|nr:glycine zipper 2TM domain-containing protein [Burkholderia ubonensis]AOK63228.1 3-hydroxyisobutyrate dehydrogenase [Burkholderia ubonensis]KVS44260.1 3-hydroxyisobutyrate dehydrogenase [Burkholderia ubonensis]KVS46930.1 3-hydroxyisobutyrate dehydrogenase [Burkholderia ubonensis]KVS80100.1 3-hydroxyisobutyrate dehydrogenase [Burkholderia ubonensis]KVS82965.1 3-hydroxyisobutyrate dehydrogenase [Burkholderia ubonensis]
MKKVMQALLLSAPLLTLAGCGTVLGATAGGVAGHELTHGSTAGTIGGAAVGGLIGHAIDR